MTELTNKSGSAPRFMFSTRLEAEYAKVIGELLAHYGFPKFSDYFRGLVYMDAVRNGLPVAGLDVPGWLTRSYPELFSKTSNPPAAERKRKGGKR